MSFRMNDELLLAPTSIQEEMKLVNTGWAFAVANGKSGVVPLNYLILVNNSSSANENKYIPIPRSSNHKKSNLKRVSFGENQIILPDDMEDSKKSCEDVNKESFNKSDDSLIKSSDDSSNSVDNDNIPKMK